MFTVSSGWLRYRPFANYALPEPVEAGWVPFRRNREEEGRMIQLYRLRWPGEWKNPVGIPATIADNWPGVTEWREQALKGLITKEGEVGSRANDFYDLRTLEQADLFPDEVPESIAYHIAVNTPDWQDSKKIRYDYPIAGLPPEYVEYVFSGAFVIKPDYMAALKYLSWLATSHLHHPMFQGFDTMIRECLMGINHEAVRLYFLLLQDCLYNPSNEWWDHSPEKCIWGRLAAYLHWVGRTGQGTYRSLADLTDEHIDRVAKMFDDQGWRRGGLEEYPTDLKDRLTAWNTTAMDACRTNAHVSEERMDEVFKELATEIEGQVGKYPTKAETDEMDDRGRGGPSPV